MSLSRRRLIGGCVAVPLAAVIVSAALATAGGRLLDVDAIGGGDRRYDWRIRAATRQYLPVTWDWRLYKALVRQESRFDPDARSSVGAAGLVQLMPATAVELGLSPEERHQPGPALDAGARYLARLWDGWERVADREPERLRTRLTLASYNAGPDRVRRAWEIAGKPSHWAPVAKELPAETQQYVTRIFEHWYPGYRARGRRQLYGYRAYLAELRRGH